ncbi:MAG: CHAT domain-containing protein [Byssovorax sp.]
MSTTMDEDDLLKKLGQLGEARELGSDPRWEALSAGKLSEAEAEAFRAEAEATEEGRRLYAMFRPFSGEEQDRSFEKLMARMGPPVGATKAKVAQKEPEAPNVVRLEAKKTRRPFLARAGVAAALAMAAGVALYLGMRPSLVSYSASITGAAVVRSAPSSAGPVTLGSPSSKLSVELHPEHGVESPRVRLFVVSAGTIYKAPPSFAWSTSQDGTVTIRDTRQALFAGVPDGTSTLVIAVGQSSALPDEEALAGQIAGPEGRASKRGYAIFWRPLVLSPGKEGSRRQLDVEFVGCDAVRRVEGRVLCDVSPESKLVLWVNRPGAAVTIDGREPAMQRKATQGGEQVSILSIPEGGKEVAVVEGKGNDVRRREVRLSPAIHDKDLDRAEALRKDDKTRREARELVTQLLDDPRPEIRALARGKLARIERAEGEVKQAIDDLRRAIDEEQKLGMISAELDDRLALSYTYTISGPGQPPDFAAARGALEEGEPRLPDYPEGRALYPYYLGLIDRESGDIRGALRRLDDAVLRAGRLGLDADARRAQRVEADVLQSLGHTAEAVSLFRLIEPAERGGKDPCDVARFLNDFGWLVTGINESDTDGITSAPDPIPLFNDALSRFDGSCGTAEERGHVRGNLAHALVVKGEVGPARKFLDEARKRMPRPSPRIEASFMLDEARIALQSGHAAEALRAYERLAALARETGLRGYDVEAALGQAQAFEADTRFDDARRAYAEADGLLDQRSRSVPIGDGKEGFLNRHERVTRMRVNFLVRRGEREPEKAQGLWAEAMTAARRGRARMLSALQWADRVDALSGEQRLAFQAAMDAYRKKRGLLDAAAEKAPEREAMMKEADQALDDAISRVGSAGAEAAPLVAPAAGELFLVFTPAQGGWAGLSLRDGTFTARSIPSFDPKGSADTVSAALLAPFADRLEGAKRVRVAAGGALSTVDIHALPWKGAPLAAQVPVVYGLDLPAALHPAPAGKARAVIVSNPGSDLTGADREAEVMRRTLEEKSYEIEELQGDDATYDNVRKLLESPGVTLLHYGSHGQFQGGRDGLGSGLGLADQRWLRAGDILSLSHAPAKVILTGCETAQASAGMAAEGLGLAQAFLTAGAEVVVASTRPVKDELAVALVERLTRSAAFPQDLGAAFSDAQRGLIRETPGADWATFRLLVP